jgi:hypothetical protein
MSPKSDKNIPDENVPMESTEKEESENKSDEAAKTVDITSDKKEVDNSSPPSGDSTNVVTVSPSIDNEAAVKEKDEQKLKDSTTPSESETKVLIYNAPPEGFASIEHVIKELVNFTERQGWTHRAEWNAPFPSHFISVGAVEYLPADNVYSWLRLLHGDGIAVEVVDKIHVRLQFLTEDISHVFALVKSDNSESHLMNGLHLTEIKNVDNAPIIPRSLSGLASLSPALSLLQRSAPAPRNVSSGTVFTEPSSTKQKKVHFMSFITIVFLVKVV